MLVTEKQAKTKLCCESIGGHKQFPCVGQKCMAWRWFYSTEEFASVKVNFPLGYCGKILVPNEGHLFPQLTSYRKHKMNDEEIKRYYESWDTEINGKEAPLL